MSTNAIQASVSSNSLPKEKANTLSKTDFKTHAYVVLSYLLIGIGVALAFCVPYFLTIIHPMIAASTPAIPVAFGVLGLQAADSGLLVDRNKPPGIKRKGMNCWANSALQFLQNCYREEFDNFKANPSSPEAYRRLFPIIQVLDTLRDEQGKQSISTVDSQKVREWGHSQMSKISNDSTSQEDPVELIVEVLKQIGATLPEANESNTIEENGQITSNTITKDNQLLAIEPPLMEVGKMKQVVQSFFQWQNESRFQTEYTYPIYETLKTGANYLPLVGRALKPLITFTYNHTPRIFSPIKKHRIETVNRGFKTPPKSLSIVKPGGDIGLKVGTPIEDAMDLTLSKEQCGQTTQYELDGFISHIGTTQDSGHYVAFIKKNGIWYKADDQVVTALSTSQAEEESKYANIFHYRKTS